MSKRNNAISVTANEEKPEVSGLDLIRCPKCHCVIAEAALGRMVIRCRSCRWWVIIKRG